MGRLRLHHSHGGRELPQSPLALLGAPLPGSKLLAHPHMDWLTLRAGRVRIPIRAPYGKPSRLDQRMGVPSHHQLLQKRTGARGHLRGGLAFRLSFVRRTLLKTPVCRANSINLSKKQTIRFMPTTAKVNYAYWLRPNGTMASSRPSPLNGKRWGF